MPDVKINTIFFRDKEGLDNYENFFICYSGLKPSYGSITITAQDYADLIAGGGIETAGELSIYSKAFNPNPDELASVFSLKEISVVKAVAVMTDKDLIPAAYRLILVDEKFYWQKKYVSHRYNVKDKSNAYISSTLNGGTPYTLTEILSDIITNDIGWGGTLNINISDPPLPPQNIVFDNIPATQALNILLEQYNISLAYDPITEEINIDYYDATDTDASTMINSLFGWEDSLFTPGAFGLIKTGNLTPSGVVTEFSIYDASVSNSFKVLSDRYYSISSTTGRPATFNSGITQRISAHNIKMTRASGVFADLANMTAEANYRSERYYERFTIDGSEYVYIVPAMFSVSNVVNGIYWSFKPEKNSHGESQLTTMTWIRLHNQDPFTNIPFLKDIEPLISETINCEVSRTSQYTTVAAFDRFSSGPAGDFYVDSPTGGGPYDFYVTKPGGTGDYKGGTAGNSPWGCIIYEGAPNRDGLFDNHESASLWIVSHAEVPRSVLVIASKTFTNALAGNDGYYPSGTYIECQGGILAGLTGDIYFEDTVSYLKAEIKGTVTLGDISLNTNNANNTSALLIVKDFRPAASVIRDNPTGGTPSTVDTKFILENCDINTLTCPNNTGDVQAKTCTIATVGATPPTPAVGQFSHFNDCVVDTYTQLNSYVRITGGKCTTACTIVDGYSYLEFRNFATYGTFAFSGSGGNFKMTDCQINAMTFNAPGVDTHVGFTMTGTTVTSSVIWPIVEPGLWTNNTFEGIAYQFQAGSFGAHKNNSYPFVGGNSIQIYGVPAFTDPDTAVFGISVGYRSTIDGNNLAGFAARFVTENDVPFGVGAIL